jgi:hypothetical protein
VLVGAHLACSRIGHSLHEYMLRNATAISICMEEDKDRSKSEALTASAATYALSPGSKYGKIAGSRQAQGQGIVPRLIAYTA